MSVLQAVVLGAVQGFTEFIPISSSGHLVLVPEALGWDAPSLEFDVLLHAASLIALVVYFREDLIALGKGLVSRDRSTIRLLGLLAIGSVPAAVAGLALGDYFERSFDDAKATAVQLVITAAILVTAEQALALHRRNAARRNRPLRTQQELRYSDSATIGVGQAISILPGISRSGIMIGAGLALGMTRDDAARFTFLLAIPALLGASALEIPELETASLGLAAAAAGFLASLVTSYVAIAGLIRYLRTRTLYPFAVYCVVAGALFYAAV